MSELLDHPQRQAARSHPDIPLVIRAGPGSGKTRVLEERIALLTLHLRALSERGRRVKVLCFTRNATREIKERVAARFDGVLPPEVDAQTFHAFGLALLRGGWATSYLGLVAPRVATRGQMLQLAVDALAEAGLPVTPWEAPRLMADVKLGHAAGLRDDRRLRAALVDYNRALRAADLIDVHDMVVEPVRILGHVAAARAQLEDEIFHVVGDEAQDWTLYHASLAAYAAGRAGHITIAGDPMQAIYPGSSPRFMTEFTLAFPRARVLVLDRSYRMHGALLRVSNAVARHIDPAAPPSRPAREEPGPLPVLHIAGTPTEEARWLAGQLRYLKAGGGLHRWRDAVVLTRTRAQRDQLAQYLTSAQGIPARTTAPPLSDRPAVAAVMAWLALLRDGADEHALLRVLDAPPRGGRGRGGRSAVRAALSRSGPWSMERLAREFPQGLTEWQRRDLCAFCRLYARLREVVSDDEPTVALDAILARTGLEAWLLATADGAAEDLARLRTLIRDEGDVGALELALAEEPVEDDGDAVLCSTVHGYKGAEADAVFLAGVDEGTFPHALALEEGPAGLAGEERAFFVGLTRARVWLAVSSGCAPGRRGREGRPSPLLARLAALPPGAIRIAG